MITAYQKALYARTRTQPAPLITEEYAANTRAIGQRYAWITALGSYYESLRGHAIAMPEAIITGRLQLAGTNIEKQAGVLPAELPAPGVIDLRTGLLWTITKNLGESCAANSSWLGFYPGQERGPGAPVDAQATCAAAWQRALAPEGQPAWGQPTRDELAFLVSGRGDKLPGAWLADAAGFPDFAKDPGIGAASLIPAPDMALWPQWLAPMSVHGNPGTNYGLATATCAERGHSTGIPDPYERPARSTYIVGQFCDYLSLQDGAWKAQCVRGGGPWQLPCSVPVVSQKGGRIAPGEPLDYGHALIFPLRRPVGAEEGFYRAP